MKSSIILLFIFLALLVVSCSTVNLAARKGEDLFLSSNEHFKLKGTYSNQALDTNKFNFKRALFENFTLDTLGRRQNAFYTDIIPIDEKTLTVNLYQQDKLFTDGQ